MDLNTPALVNDLDIRVSKDGNTFFPWKLNPGSVSAAATKGDNTVDNVEKVEIGASAGTYTITVSHKGSLTNGSQRFALIVSSGTPAIPVTCSSTVSSFPYAESFESGTGAWSQGSGDDFDWSRNSGGTPSSGTGPSAGF